MHCSSKVLAKSFLLNVNNSSIWAESLKASLFIFLYGDIINERASTGSDVNPMRLILYLMGHFFWSRALGICWSQRYHSQSQTQCSPHTGLRTGLALAMEGRDGQVDRASFRSDFWVLFEFRDGRHFWFELAGLKLNQVPPFPDLSTCIPCLHSILCL